MGKSGTTISEMGTSYGISNRFGGKINGQKVTATDEEQGQQRRHCLLGPQHRHPLLRQRPPADPLNAAVDARAAAERVHVWFWCGSPQGCPCTHAPVVVMW